jgi:hypothetical protein
LSTLINAACKDSEDLFDEHPELDERSARSGSERIPRLLFTALEMDFFRGRWPHPFAFLEEERGLEDVLFDRLLDESEVTVDGEEAVRYLEQLLSLLRQREGEMPPVYSFSSQKGELFSETIAGESLRVQAGFDHCVLIDDKTDKVKDLRRQTFVDTPVGRLQILQEPVVDYCGSDVEDFLRVAKTSERYSRSFVLTVI